MKTLSEVCKSTLSSAEETTNLPVEQAYSSTKNGGLTIMNAKQLVQNTVEDNDKNLLASLKHTLKLSIDVETKSRFTDYGWEPVKTVNIAKMTQEQRSKALQMIEAYNAPMSSKGIIALMARLAVISPEREKTNIDVEARASIWCEELSEFPADVVYKALKADYRWFPSLAEVKEKCRNDIAYRKLLEYGIRCYREN